MEKTTRIAAAFGFALCAAVSGCGSSRDAAQASEASSSAAERAIVEADIVQLDGGRLYALSASGTVSVVDVGTPGRLALLGQKQLGGRPFEMYRRGETLVTMLNGAFTASGAPIPPQTASSDAPYRPAESRDPNASAGVVVLDLRDPMQLGAIATFPVAGELADSRIVGDVLYLATYENAYCWSCTGTPRTQVTSFDLKDPTSLRKLDQVSFDSGTSDGAQLAWGESSWKRSIFVTTQRMYVGGHIDLDPRTADFTNNRYKEGVVDVIDISDPSGRLVRGAQLQVAGAILSRWQLDERNGVLRVVSQAGAGRSSNGFDYPLVETFRINSTQDFAPLGQTTLQLPHQEGLRTVRFDDNRAYAVTYFQGDPLYAIDLSDPASPTVRGELHIPGYMFYLEPHGDRLIGLGVDNADPRGSLNVSLFDVQNLDQPRLIERVPFSTPSVGSNYTIVNYELPEDQDRIQKAFRVFNDGLVAVPFTYASSYYSGQGDGCDTVHGAVQLIDWKNDTLRARTQLELRGNPRRAFENAGELVAVSDSNVTSFSLSANSAVKTADITIGPCTLKEGPYDYNEWGDDTFGWFACSVSTKRPQNATGAWACGLFALLALARFARRHRAK